MKFRFIFHSCPALREFPDGFRTLQIREFDGLRWTTVPSVEFDELSPEDQSQIIEDLAALAKPVNHFPRNNMNISPPSGFTKVDRVEFDRIMALNSSFEMRRDGWANCARYQAKDRWEWVDCAFQMDDGACYVHPFLKTEP